ncbi:MAG TPA: AMP-binding protein [Acidobacteriaceae bacterium]|nr:AMP-binding protein [Acidobacteriaceae bacterium]
MRKHLATFVEDFQRHGHQIAIVQYSGNRRVATSYGELAQLAGRFSRYLEQQGIGAGERVLLWGANSSTWVAAFFGCVLRGVIVVPLDAAGSADFAARVISEVSPSLLLGDESLLQSLNTSLPRLLLESLSAWLPAQTTLQQELSLGIDTPLQIIFTSGTTSAPKGVVHTHGNVLASVDVLEREIKKYLRYERWFHPIRFLHTLPLSHVFGQFMGLWVPPLLAAEVHYEHKLVAGHLIGRIRRERISVAAVVPRVVELMRNELLALDAHLSERLKAAEKKSKWLAWWKFRDIHRKFGWKFWAFVCGGATLPASLEAFWTTLGFAMVQGYGMTETTALATLNHPFHPARGSIGKALGGREVRVAEDGEILVRGAMLAAGTWRDGRMVARTEEWLHTGDLGAVEANGQVRFVGRKGDMIVTPSGMNIHPADLEQAMLAQPGVRDCVVVGWEGPSGTEPVAVILSEDEFDSSGPKRILNEANRTLLEFQQIRNVLRWPGEEFPRNALGKLLRREVSAWVNEQLRGTLVTGGERKQDALLQLIQQVGGHAPPDVSDSADLTADLRLDSLGRMQLAAAMEERFNVAVEDASITATATLGDLRKLVRASGTQPRVEPVQKARSQEVVAQRGRVNSAEPVRPIEHSLQNASSELLPQYPRWPWSPPVQMLRVLFLECVVRPLVFLLAGPRVVCDPARLPKSPSIYVANHVTAIDVPLLLFALPRRVRQHMAVAMSADLIAAWRKANVAAGVGAGPLRWLAPVQARLVIALFNAFPLPAGSGLRRSFDHIGETLDRGFNVLVFPEGRRSTDGNLQRFQTGISVLAQESRTEVVPMGLIGLSQAARHPRLRPIGLTVAVGAPERQAPGESHVQFADRLQNTVKRIILSA